MLRSFKTRVTLLVVLMLLASVWSVTFYVSQSVREEMEQKVGEHELLTVSSMATEINMQLEARIDILRRTAALIRARMMADPASLQAWLERRGGAYSFFNRGILVADRSGNIIAEFPHEPGRRGINIREREHFIGAVEAGKATIGHPVSSKLHHTPIFPIGVPIRDSRRNIIGMLGGVVDLSQSNFIDKIAKGSYRKTGDFLLVDAADRLIITASDKSRAMERLPAAGTDFAVDRMIEHPGSAQVMTDAHGRQVLASAAPVPAARWLVGAMLPTAELFAPIDDMVRHARLEAAILSLFLVGAFWWLLRREFAPLTATVDTLARHASADQPAQDLPLVRRDEFGQLIDGFNRLLRRLREREQNLRDSEARYRTIAQLSADWYWEQDENLRFTELSKPDTGQRDIELDTFLGHTRREAPGVVWDEPALTELEAITAARQPFQDFEIGRSYRSGPKHYVRMSGEPVFDESGAFKGYRGVGTDITERRRIESALGEAEQLYRFILKTAMDGFWLADAEGRLLEVNDAYCAMSGYSASELRGMRIADLDAIETPDAAAAHMQRIVARGEDRFETRHRRKDGSVYDVEVSVKHRSFGGRGFATFVRDISARKRAEMALRQFRDIVESTDDAIVAKAPDGTIVSWNAGAAKLFGYGAEEAIGRPVSMLIPPERRLEEQDILARIARGERIEHFETLRQRKDGQLIDVSVTISPIADEDGKVLGASKIARNTSERKRGEAMLRTRLRLTELAQTGTMEELLRYALDQAEALTRSEIGFFHFVDADQEHLTLQAWSSNTLAGMCTAEGAGQHYPISAAGVWVEAFHRRAPVIHDDYAGLAQRKGMPAGHAPVTRELVVPIVRAGKVTEILGVGNKASGYLPEDVEAVQLIAELVQDLVERRRTEAALRESERRFGALMRKVELVGLMLDARGRITFANDYLLRLTGWRREEVLGQDWFEIFIPPDSEVRAVFQESIGRGDVPSHYENAILGRDGAQLVIAWNNTLLRDEAGAVVGVACLGEDITERQRLDQALRDSEQFLSTLYQASPVGISISSVEEGKILEINEAAPRIYGYRREELIGRTVAELDLYVDPAQRQQLLDTLDASGSVEGVEARLRHCNGGIVVVLLSMRKIKLRSETVLLNMQVDVTDYKRVEEMHRQAQRLESLGTLAAGIAHDFNNILTAIRGNVELAAEDVGPDHVAAQSLAEIQAASGRATELVRRILAFARPREPKEELVDLGAIVREVLNLLRSTLPAGIALKTAFDADVPRVRADVGQVHEVIVNLTTNAAHAIMPQTGRIEYRLEALHLDAEQAQASAGLSAGNYVCLSVRDSGRGMDAATMERIFDAFYTTKPLGEGSGLGLSMVHGTMKGHGGAVTVESAPGEGATFALYFPAAEGDQPAADAAAPRAAVRGAAQRVIFIDDEAALLSLGTRMLTRKGHRVTSFSDPQAALDAFSANPQDFDVVVTDLAMPHMSGFELAGKLLAMRPGLPVLLVSGYLAPDDQNIARFVGIREVLQKPLDWDELALALDRIAANSAQDAG